MSKIKTAVIPAGGFGTRFLPATKSIPKEMFPLGNKPVILHVVEEVVKSGIENIIFIVAHHKQSIESFFSSNEILENYYTSIGRREQVEELKRIESLAAFSFVYTHPPGGNGGALMSARHLLGDEPFLYIWSDEIILTTGKPRALQCLETFEKYGQPVISAIKIPDPHKRNRYGMAELRDLKGSKDVKEVVRIVEKPALGDEPSEYAAHGAYVLPPEIFNAFDKVKPEKYGEIWITDLINIMKEKTGLLAKIIPDGLYLDCGNPLEYLRSQLEYALKFTPHHEEILETIKAYAKSKR